MELHTLTRQHISHEDFLDQHPGLVWRIFLGVLPVLYMSLTHLYLLYENHAVNLKFHTKTYPHNHYWTATVLIAVACTTTLGLWAAYGDPWDWKNWILYSVSTFLPGLGAVTYHYSTHRALFITAIVLIAAYVTNKWLFIDAMSMADGDPELVDERELSRNFIGFNQAGLTHWFLQTVGQNLVHNLGWTQKNEAIFFWIVYILWGVGMEIWNIVSFGPFYESLGYIFGYVMLLIGSLVSTVYFNHDGEEPLIEDKRAIK